MRDSATQPIAKKLDHMVGFTLVELLVVISIIALLLGILLPSLGQAREAARAVVCQTNQRNLGSVVLMYTNEHNGKMPGSEEWSDVVMDAINAEWPASSLLCSRDTMPEVLFCPCDDDPFPKPYMTGTMEVTSYMCNGAATDFAMGSGAQVKLGLFGGEGRLTDVRVPSSCMMLGEGTNYDKVADFDHPAVSDAFAAAGVSASAARRRFHHRVTSGFYHRGRMNIYYMDGHSAPLAGKTVDPLPLSQWPGGALMSSETTFYPTLSLPTAAENPDFWGPPYTN
jgi:prepilin-type N-terminal cleavage/methylation domain-containing protein/prepilin-type processing-associated H-X9-DG protein